jgi:hypothetical protein
MRPKKRWIAWTLPAVLLGIGLYASQVQAQLPSEGVTGYQRVSASSDDSTAKNKTASASCPAGTVVTGGGHTISGKNPGSAVVYSSAPNGDGTWRVLAKRTVSISKTWTLTAWALCVEGSGSATASPSASPSGSPTASPTASPSPSPST